MNETWKVAIETADPNVHYHKNRTYNNGNVLYEAEISGAHMPEIRDKADAWVEKMLAHGYTDWLNVPKAMRLTQEDRNKVVCDPQYKDYSTVTHKVDMFCPWMGEGESGDDEDDHGDWHMIKYVYTAYDTDFEGYDRYRATLTPISTQG